MVISERYNPLPLAAGATLNITGSALGGFICSTSGTITIVSNKQDGKVQTTLLTSFPVTGGVYYPLPIFIGKNGGTITSASAVGLVLV